MKLLVTGFGSFGTVTENPSAVLARACGRESRILEVSYAEVSRFLNSQEALFAPAFLFMGVATNRTKITPELFARNHRGDKKDVRGEALFGLIEEHGPLLVPATIWKSEDLADWSEHLPVHPSLDAGNYLCNDLAYRALRKFPEKPIGFLHVPPFDALDLATQSSVLQRILARLEAGEGHNLSP
ncbi:pyroglutamyl-peptidase I [soil metagenome]